MEIFEFIFYLGVVNIIFSAVWKILATIFSSILKDIGIDKDVTFFAFKAAGYYILVSITALITAAHMHGTYTLAAVAYAVTGTFVIYATIASNLERNRWRAVMNFERKRIRVMRYDGYLLMACIILFISTLIKPEISDFRFQEWALASIDKIYNAPVLKYIIGFFAFFYMLNIIFRGIKASDEVLAVLFNRKRKKSNTQGSQDEATGFTDYEEVIQDDAGEPK